MMARAESTSVAWSGADFDEFYRAVEPRIRRALVAVCGLAAGIDATAAAMHLGFEGWDELRVMENPAGTSTASDATPPDRDASRFRRSIPTSLSVTDSNPASLPR